MKREFSIGPALAAFVGCRFCRSTCSGRSTPPGASRSARWRD